MAWTPALLPRLKAMSATGPTIPSDGSKGGVSVNSICPSAIDTPMLRVFINRPAHDEADPKCGLVTSWRRTVVTRVAAVS